MLRKARPEATRFGRNGGLGTWIRVARLRTFLEARYHGAGQATSRATAFPPTVGIAL